MPELNPNEWEIFLAERPNSHILQTTSWGQLKAEFGWQVKHVALDNCGAQILIKQILPGIRFAYIPKGPIGLEWDELVPEIDAVCKKWKCAFLKIEPDVWADEPSHQKVPAGFIHSDHCIQPMRTLIIDISSGDEAKILGRMKQKTRYNINLALKKNVIVKPHTELGSFYNLMEVTGQRDQFGIHDQKYYQRAFDLFNARDECRLLVAEFEGEPLAALIVFKYGARAWYFYGASSDQHRDKMPNYLLQWEAIRWARSQDCIEYDLWGVPDADISTLEENFTKFDKGLWGVYRFKRGFGGELRRSSGPWDRIYQPFVYRIYSLWMKYRNPEA